MGQEAILFVDGDYNWIVVDTARGMASADNTDSKYLTPNTNNDEDTGRIFYKTATGFTISAGSMLNNDKHVYVAIKSTVNTDTYYSTKELEEINGQEIINKYGISPDSIAAKQLGFRELTEQPDYPVAGYELQDNGKYEPIEDQHAEVRHLKAELVKSEIEKAALIREIKKTAEKEEDGTA